MYLFLHHITSDFDFAFMSWCARLCIAALREMVRRIYSLVYMDSSASNTVTCSVMRQR